MNGADIVILVIAGAAAYFGLRLGTIRQFFSLVGVVAGFFVAALIYDKLAFLTQESGLRTLVLGGVLLGTTFLFFDLFMVAGKWLQRTWKSPFTGSVADKIGSGVVTAAGSIAVLWLLALIFTTVLPQTLRAQVEGSLIFSTIAKNGVPKTFTSVSQLLTPFGSPEVFVGNEPQYSGVTVNQTFEALDAATETTKQSVAKVTAWGCGSVSAASGFLVSKRHIVTNAHVVAGSDRISVQNQGAVYVGKLVWFDPKLDIAILVTENDLPGTPLALNESSVGAGSVTAVLGFPEGGSLMTGDAIVLEQLQADGYDIYRKEKVVRSVYAVRSDVVPGNSGGPVINSRGEVVGVIFGHSTTQAKVGYALSVSQIGSTVKNVQTLQTQVSAGSCTDG